MPIQDSDAGRVLIRRGAYDRQLNDALFGFRSFIVGGVGHDYRQLYQPLIDMIDVRALRHYYRRIRWDRGQYQLLITKFFTDFGLIEGFSKAFPAVFGEAVALGAQMGFVIAESHGHDFRGC